MRATRLIAAAVMAVVTMLSVVVGAVASERVAEITIGTHNTLRGAASFERFAGVIGWQEVNDPADRGKLRDRLGSEYATFLPAAGPAKAVPISWRVNRFTKLSAGSVRTHGGEAGVTPARYVNWVVLRVRGTDKHLIVVNTHFISGAWSGHPERQARWNTHYRVLKDRVATLRRNHPSKPIFVVGDFNRRKAMDLPSPLRWVRVKGVSGVPIDHMYAPTTVSHSMATRLPKWGSDHHAYRMSASI